MKNFKPMLRVDMNSWNWVVGNKCEGLVKGKQYLLKTTHRNHKGRETGTYYFIREPSLDNAGVLCFLILKLIIMVVTIKF